MKNKKIICLIALIIVLIVIVIIVINKKDDGLNDSIKFKEEYEKYNGKTTSSGKNYLNISLSSNNIMKYSSLSEVKELISSKTGVIYLGFPECPWCRNMLPVLLDAASSTSLENIYYVNMLDLRDKIELVDGELVTTKEAAKDYYEVVDLLKDILNDYTVEDNEGNSYNTSKKRIYVPIVLFVHNGKLVGYHANTVESQTDPYIALNDEQKEELYKIYEGNIHKVLDDLCDEGC